MKNLLLALSLLPLASFAAESQAYDGSGVYVNINTGVAKYQDMPVGSWMGTVNAGYSFNKYIAAEGGYSVFASQQYGANATTNIIDIAAKGTLPLASFLGIYGRLGVGYGINGWSGTAGSGCSLCQSNNASDYALGLAGVGVSFSLSRSIDLRVEDVLYVPFANTFAGGTINAVTGGVQVNF